MIGLSCNSSNSTNNSFISKSHSFLSFTTHKHNKTTKQQTNKQTNTPTNTNKHNTTLAPLRLVVKRYFLPSLIHQGNGRIFSSQLHNFLTLHRIESLRTSSSRVSPNIGTLNKNSTLTFTPSSNTRTLAQESERRTRSHA